MPTTREKFKVYKNVFDNFTERTLFKLSSQGHFDELKSPLFIGKESNVFTAKKDDGLVIVKIYRLETCDFNRMYDYIKQDNRYQNLKKNRRNIIFAWTQREFRNLMMAREAGVNVPTPHAFFNNIIVMEMIGNFSPSLRMKDDVPKNKNDFFKKVVSNMKKLHNASIVHGDLSEYNILNQNGNPVFIDFSQSTTTKSPNANELLDRDIRNIARFFIKKGVKTSEESIKKAITSFKKKG